MLPSSIHSLALLLFVINPISTLNTVNIPPNVSSPTNSSYNYTNASCTSLLTHANATASKSFQSLLLDDISLHNLATIASETLLLTAAVNEVVNNATNATAADTTIWFGVHQDRNLPQDGLPFAGCAIIIDGLPLDSIKRGQADDGSCKQTFSDSCTKALTKRVATISDSLSDYAVGGEYGNRTTEMYPQICDIIATQLSNKENVPNECKKFRDEASEVLWFRYETERTFFPAP